MNPIQIKCRAPDAVGEPSDGSAKVTAVLHIFLDAVVSEADVNLFSRGGGNDHGTDCRTICKDGDLHPVCVV